MEDNRTYNWKIYRKGRYDDLICDTKTVNIEDIDLNIIDEFYIKEDFVSIFKKQYKFIAIDKDSFNTIKYLIKKYNLNFTENQLVLLSAIIQKDLVGYASNPIDNNNNQYDDIVTEYFEIIDLFKLIETRLKNLSFQGFKKIIFQFSQETTIKSAFVLIDILDGLIQFYEINTENLNEKLEERLSITTNFDLINLLEVQKLKHIEVLDRFILMHSQKIPFERKNRFIVAFLSLSQIPISKLAKEILIPKELKEISKADLNNLAKKLKGKHSIFFK